MDIPKEISLLDKHLESEYKKAWYAQIPEPIVLGPVIHKIQSYRLVDNILELTIFVDIKGHERYFTQFYDIEKEKDFVSVILGGDRQVQFDFFSFDEFGISTYFRNRVIDQIVEKYR